MLWTSGHWLVIKTSQVPLLAVALHHAMILGKLFTRVCPYTSDSLTKHGITKMCVFHLIFFPEVLGGQEVSCWAERWSQSTDRVTRSKPSSPRRYWAGIFGRPNSSTGTPSCVTHMNHSDQQINVCKKMPSFHELVVWWTRDQRMIFPNCSQYYEFSSVHWQC